jgi:hypothetical protein
MESINRLSLLGSRIMLWGTGAGVAIWISISLLMRGSQSNLGLLELVFLVAFTDWWTTAYHRLAYPAVGGKADLVENLWR